MERSPRIHRIEPEASASSDPKSVNVDGQSFEGPVFVSRRSRLKEFRFVDLGADRGGTAVRVAAPDAPDAIHQRGEAMPPGPGTALHAALKRFGITANPGCQCQRHIREMNERGIDWCLANVETIVGWLEEEARRRGLPFVRSMASRFVWAVLGRFAKSRTGATGPDGP